MSIGLVIHRGSELTFMDSLRQKMIDITIYSEKVAGTGLKSVRRTVRIGPQAD